jgi:hypothetical protein
MPRPIARSIGQPAAYAHQALIGPSGGGASSWPVDLRDRTLGWLYALPRRLARLLRRVLIPSVLGIVIGGVVGLMGKTLVLPPETAPLGWLFISATKLGEAAVPINLVLLGAALSRRPESKDLPVLTAVRNGPSLTLLFPSSLVETFSLFGLGRALRACKRCAKPKLVPSPSGSVLI